MVAFDTDKIKDKFENPFLMTQDNASSKKGLFGFEAGESVKKADLKGVFKEVAALLNSEGGDSSLPKDPLAAAKGSVQKFVGTREKAVDQPQIQAVETKVSESEIKIELPKARPAAKPLPAYVTQQVGKSLVRAINQGENTLKIQLKPPELGRLMMTIDNTGNSMRVSIMTENHAAKEIITQNMTELRTVLSNSGVNLERFEVDMSSDFRQSMADARQQAGHSGKQGKNKGQAESGNGPSGGINETAGEMIGLNQDGSVHLVA